MVVWSFFSGAFGLDLGLEKGGILTALAVEKDRFCCATISANRPDLRVLEADVEHIDGSLLRRATGYAGEVDLMVGGPPCQSFSPGGSRAALSDPRGNLIYEYLRLVADIQPERFVLENVANLVTAALQHRPIDERPGKHWSLKKYSDAQINLQLPGEPPPLGPDEQAGSAMRQICSDLQKLGYQVNFGILNAAHFGSAQKRLRFFLLGSRGGDPPALPSPTHGRGLESPRTLRDALDGLENPGPGSEYTSEVRDVFKMIPPGGNWRDLPDEVAKRAMGGSYAAGGGKTGFFRRLSWDEPAPTITGRANRKGSALCHPDEDRPLTVRECARVQGFPDDWQFVGSMSQQYLQVGNAVPVDLAAAVGASLVDGSVESSVGSMKTLLTEAQVELRSYGRNNRKTSKAGAVS